MIKIRDKKQISRPNNEHPKNLHNASKSCSRPKTTSTKSMVSPNFDHTTMRKKTQHYELDGWKHGGCTSGSIFIILDFAGNMGDSIGPAQTLPRSQHFSLIVAHQPSGQLAFRLGDSKCHHVAAYQSTRSPAATQIVAVQSHCPHPSPQTCYFSAARVSLSTA